MELDKEMIGIMNEWYDDIIVGMLICLESF